MSILPSLFVTTSRYHYVRTHTVHSIYHAHTHIHRDKQVNTSQSVQKTMPTLGSREMALGFSMSEVMSVLLYDPLSLATSIWFKLLSTQYRFSPIQSTASPSAVDSPVCTTTSMLVSTVGKIEG